jgi:hypothetical protein
VNIDQLLARQRQPANQEKYRRQDWKGKLCDEANKTRRLHFVLLGDCLDHEIGTVADVSRGSEQNSAHGNGGHLGFAAGKEFLHGGRMSTGDMKKNFVNLNELTTFQSLDLGARMSILQRDCRRGAKIRESRRGHDRDARILQTFVEKFSTEDNDGTKRASEFGLNYGHASVNMRARNAQ